MSRPRRHRRRARGHWAGTVRAAALAACSAAAPAAAENPGQPLDLGLLDTAAGAAAGTGANIAAVPEPQATAGGPPDFFSLRVEGVGDDAGNEDGPDNATAIASLDGAGFGGSLRVGALNFKDFAPDGLLGARAMPGVMVSGEFGDGLLGVTAGHSFGTGDTDTAPTGSSGYRVSLAPLRTAAVALDVTGGFFEIARSAQEGEDAESLRIWSAGATLGLWDDRMEVEAEAMRARRTGSAAGRGAGTSMSLRADFDALDGRHDAGLAPYATVSHTSERFDAVDGAKPGRRALGAGFDAAYGGAALHYGWQRSRTAKPGNSGHPAMHRTEHRAGLSLGLDRIRRELGLADAEGPLMPRTVSLDYGWLGERKAEGPHGDGAVPGNRRQRLALDVDWRWDSAIDYATSISISREAFDNSAVGSETADTRRYGLRLGETVTGPDWRLGASVAHSRFANANRDARRRERSWELCVEAGWEPKGWPDLRASFRRRLDVVHLDSQGRTEDGARNRFEVSADFGAWVPAFAWADDEDNYLRASYVRDRKTERAAGGVYGVDQRFLVEYGITY